MSDLTEKLKAGELPHGAFYVRIEGVVLIDFFDAAKLKFVRFKESAIDEVLAPVPSYERYKDLKRGYDRFMSQVPNSGLNIAYLRLGEENEALKKKLKIAIDALKEYETIKTYDWIDSQSVAKKALFKIDEVK